MENTTGESHCGGKGGCKCLCHKATGILITLIGIVFLLGAFSILSQQAVSVIWPVLVILIGLKKTCGKGKCKCCARG